MPYVMLLILSCFISVPLGWAEEGADAVAYTRLTLSETVEQKMPQDRIRATLSYQAERPTAEEAQRSLNKEVALLLGMLKHEKDVDAYTERYHVQERWNSRLKKHDGFIATQSVILESAEEKRLTSYVEKAQREGFKVSGLSYYLSDDAQDKAKDVLIVKALDRIKQRARVVAKNLSVDTYHLADIQVNYGALPPVHGMPERHMMAKTEDLSFSAPSVKGKDEAVSVNVHAIVLFPR